MARVRRTRRPGKDGNQNKSASNVPLVSSEYLPAVDEYTWLDPDTFNLYSYATAQDISSTVPVSPTTSAAPTAPESTTSTKSKLDPQAPVFIPTASASLGETIENPHSVPCELKKARDNWTCDFCGWECFCVEYV